MKVDLHVHTNASDGTDSPEEVVMKAKTLGLCGVAITDHDSLSGVEPAISAGKLHNIYIVPGIEMGSELDGEEIHILGYLMELHDEKFLERLKTFRVSRVSRMEQMVNILRDLGIVIDMNMVQAISGEGAVGRPHLATALVRSGVVRNTSEAFETLIGAGCPAYVPRCKLEPEEAVRLIRDAGGLPVLAHPGLNHSTQLVGDLIAAGLVGIEAYHPAHSYEQASYYHRLAKENDLVVTGGSDYHGTERKAGSNLGSETVPFTVIEELILRRGK